MQPKNLLKLIWMALLLGPLSAVITTPIAAQGPNEGDVGVQAVNFTAFLWNPATTFVSRGDGRVSVKLNAQGAQQISGLTLSIGYPASAVTPQNITPGDLLPGTRGVDYFFTVQMGGGALACGGDSSFKVNIVYFDPTLTVNGSGSLIDILWRSDPDAAVGDTGAICLDGATSLVTDNGGFPGPALSNVAGSITVQPTSLFKFQIGLEGGKNAGLPVMAAPDNLFTDVKINGLYPCDGGSVDALGFCAFNNAAINPPYTVAVSRRGYLDAGAFFANPHDATTIYLWAGDLNDDNVVNILDIVLMASVLNQPAGTSTLSQAADYTGAPSAPGDAPAPDGIINIIDLVFVAKNFGTSGPTDGAPPGGNFPF